MSDFFHSCWDELVWLMGLRKPDNLKAFVGRFQKPFDEVSLRQAAIRRELLNQIALPRPEFIDREALLDRLPRDTALVIYLRYTLLDPGRSAQLRYGALVLARNQDAAWISLGDGHRINSLVANYQDAMRLPEKQAPSDAQMDRILSDLEQAIWKPVEALVPRSTRSVMLSPDGALNFVSFATLRWNGGNRSRV